MVRWNRVMGLGILALMLLPSFAVALAADVIYVWTDDSYGPGDSVEVEGATNVTGTVTITITNSSGHEILSLTNDPDEDGEFSVNFQLEENAAVGTYGVNATVGYIYETTSFEVDAEVTDEEEGENPSDFSSSDLTCAIDRAFRYIDKVNKTAIALDQEGYNVTYFLDTLEELNDTLTVILFNMTNNSITPEEGVEKFSELRGDLGRLNGLLHSCTKKFKEERTERYIEHMEKLINSTIDKIERFETDKGEKLRAALEAQERKLWRLRLYLNISNLENTINTLEDSVEEIDRSLTDFDSEGFSLKEMYKVQARIQVFHATVERMRKKGKTMNRLEEKLGNAEHLMYQMQEQFGELTQAQLKAMVEEAEENLSGVGKAIRELNKTDKQDKGGKGKGDGDGGQ